MTTPRSVFQDRELVGLLGEEPELLAIADALIATRPASSSGPRRRPAASIGYGRRRIATFASAVAATAGVVVLLLVAPWQHGPSLTEQALAAIGDGPVLHLVTTQPGRPLVDLASGQELARTERVEIWFDRDRSLKKTVSALDGRLLDEQLETATGGVTSTGPIYTCAWIAAHPVEAQKARVGCAAGASSTASAPSVDPALAGFVDRYQSALASGAATQVGTGEVDGHEVVWLQFDAGGEPERVAVDTTTHLPVRLQLKRGDGPFEVLTAETLAYDPSFFSRPTPLATTSGGSVASETEVTPQQAAASLGGELLWPGADWSGLSLQSVVRQVRTVVRTGSGRGDVTAIRLTYRPASGTGDGSGPRIDVYESDTCLISVGWTCTALDPADSGTLADPGPGFPFEIALLRHDGLYVSIWRVGAGLPRVIDLARALEPLTAGSG